jgi:hypothetical protein
MADRARLLLLVQHPPSAAYWPRVAARGATIAGDGRPLHVFSNPATTLSHAGSYNTLALFALDFNQHPDADSFLHAAPCGQESLAGRQLRVNRHSTRLTVD